MLGIGDKIDSAKKAVTDPIFESSATVSREEYQKTQEYLEENTMSGPPPLFGAITGIGGAVGAAANVGRLSKIGDKLAKVIPGGAKTIGGAVVGGTLGKEIHDETTSNPISLERVAIDEPIPVVDQPTIPFSYLAGIAAVGIILIAGGSR